MSGYFYIPRGTLELFVVNVDIYFSRVKLVYSDKDITCIIDVLSKIKNVNFILGIKTNNR